MAKQCTMFPNRAHLTLQLLGFLGSYSMSSRSESLLFVGSYASADEPGLHAFHFDEASGALVPRGAVSGVTNPSFLATHPGRRWLYTVSETAEQGDGMSGAVWAFHIGQEGTPLQPINHQPSGGDLPCHLVCDSAGKWLLVPNYGSGTVGVLPVQPDGSLGELADLVEHHGNGPNPDRQEGPHPHSVTFAPGDAFVIVADLGADRLAIYRFDSSTGQLSTHAHVDTRPGAGPRHLAFHPNGQYLYVANELDNTVAVYSYDPAGGMLLERQVVDTIPPGAPENTVADIHLLPSGSRLYVSNRGHNSVAVFEVASDGGLSRIVVPPCGGNWPRNFALAPGGQHLLVANQYSDEISVLPVQPGGTELGTPGAGVTVPRPACVHFLA